MAKLKTFLAILAKLKTFIYLNHLGNMEFEKKFFSANKFILSLHKKPLVMYTNKPKI